MPYKFSSGIMQHNIKKTLNEYRCTDFPYLVGTVSPRCVNICGSNFASAVVSSLLAWNLEVVINDLFRQVVRCGDRNRSFGTPYQRLRGDGCDAHKIRGASTDILQWEMDGCFALYFPFALAPASIYSS